MSNTTPAVSRFPLEKFANRTPEGAAAFRDQSAVLQAARLIRQMREGAELTQRELAKRVGTPQPYLSELERGTGAQGPTFLMLQRIAKACGTELRIEVDARQHAREGASVEVGASTQAEAVELAATAKEKLAHADGKVREALGKAWGSSPTAWDLAGHFTDISKVFANQYLDWVLQQPAVEIGPQVAAMGYLIEQLPEMKIAAEVGHYREPVGSSSASPGPERFLFRKQSHA